MIERERERKREAQRQREKHTETEREKNTHTHTQRKYSEMGGLGSELVSSLGDEIYMKEIER